VLSDEELTLLLEFNARGKILFHLNVVQEENLRQLVRRRSLPWLNLIQEGIREEELNFQQKHFFP